MDGWGQRRELSLGMRILLQVLRFALAALFFYIAYLGIIWRSTPPPAPPAQRQLQPAAPAKPAPPRAPAPEGTKPPAEKAR